MIEVTNGYVTVKIMKKELKKFLESGYREIHKEKIVKEEILPEDEQSNVKSRTKHRQSKQID